MAGVSRLDLEDGLREQFAELYISGHSRVEMADALGANKHTITRWLKDPELQKMISDMREARINRMLRKTDAQLMEQLDSGRIKDTKMLLELRKTLAPAPSKTAVELSGGVAMEDAAAALWKKLSEDPDLAAKLLGEELTGTAGA